MRKVIKIERRVLVKQYLKENKFFFIGLIIIILLFNIRLPYYINTPGGTIDIADRIEYEDKVEYEGSLNMLYVTEYVATIPTYLLSYVIKDWDREKLENSQISDETPEEIEVRNKVMLDNSIHNAIYVAYQAANCSIEITDKKTIVIGTMLSNGLKIGDELLKVDGKDIEDVEMIKSLIQEKKIGDTLTFQLLRDGKEKEVVSEIKTIEDKKGIGVVIITDYDLEMDPEIELEFKKSESGSSGGLMMTLSIYSAISGTDILKGRNIAGTGTIDRNGNVGEIDGIKYKIIGAVKNKMDVVLVPSGNYEEAKKVVKEKGYDIELVEVKTFEDAIRYLEK